MHKISTIFSNSNLNQYEKEYKIEVVKLSKEIGIKRVSEELCIPYNTLRGWIKKARKDEIDLGIGSSNPDEAMSLSAEVQILRKQNKEVNEFLEEVSAFFTSYCLKFVRNKCVKYC